MTDLTRSHDDRQVPAVGTWAIDPTHSEVGFTSRHLMLAKVRGSFSDFSGTIEVAEDPAQSRVDVTIDAGSITTGVGDRDGHLKSADFLDVENHETLQFASTSVEPHGDDWKVSGDLTIRGTTKPVVLDVEFHGAATDPWGNGKAAFSAATEIDRTEWGLVWNAPLEAGGVLVGEKVKITIEAQAALQN